MHSNGHTDVGLKEQAACSWYIAVVMHTVVICCYKAAVQDGSGTEFLQFPQDNTRAVCQNLSEPSTSKSILGVVGACQ